MGALEQIWAGHAEAIYSDDTVENPSATVYKAAIKEHERIVAAIERGDPRVGALAQAHLEATQSYVTEVDDARRITASVVQRSY